MFTRIRGDDIEAGSQRDLEWLGFCKELECDGVGQACRLVYGNNKKES
jgi:hypothetical protein